MLSDEWDEKLARLKSLAQQDDEVSQAVAQVTICEHLFEVRDRGAGRFSFVLVDNAFRLQVSNARSKSLPLAYVQISSDYLSHAGIEQAETALRYVVNTLGLVHEPANVSRVDLFADFSAMCRMDAFDPLRDWVTRVESMSLHYSQGRFSGWSFGSGGDIVARLYDKTLEVEQKSHKFYLHEMWRATGWDGSCDVWRMEFEAKRNALVSLQLPKLAQLLPNLPSLWRYLTENWLRLTVRPSRTVIVLAGSIIRYGISSRRRSIREWISPSWCASILRVCRRMSGCSCMGWAGLLRSWRVEASRIWARVLASSSIKPRSITPFARAWSTTD